MKVTRVAYSRHLNSGKWAALTEQARRLGRVRSLVWQRYGSVAGAALRDRAVRDRWMSDGTADTFGVLANPWKETVRDAMADIAANREAAKVGVRRAIRRHVANRHAANDVERKRLFALLKSDRWVDDPYLRRQMRNHWPRGKNHTANQIVVRADQFRIFTLIEGGDVWLAVPGLDRGRRVAIPLNTTVAPAGTLRLILRGGRVEVHYQIDAADMPSSQPCGTATVGVDKGYTEVLTDSDGNHHGTDLGVLLAAESDRLKERNRRRAKLRSVANQAAQRGNRAKADRIRRNNLGTLKRDRQATRRKKLSKNMNRRLAAWTKGVTAEALTNVSERRGSALVLVNAAYTSQVDPGSGSLAVRRGDRLHCASGVVWHADHAAAVNILHRHGDPDIALHTPHKRVKQILQERTDRQRIRLPIQDSSRDIDGGERTIRDAHTSTAVSRK